MADNAPAPPETPLEPPEGLSDVVSDATTGPLDGQVPEGAPTGNNLGDKLKSVPSYVWIGIAIAAGTLIIGIMAYRRQVAGGSAYQSGYNTTGLPSSDGTNGFALDSSGANWSTFLQNQETQNGLLQSLISKLGNQKPTVINNYNSGGGSGTKKHDPLRRPPIQSGPVSIYQRLGLSSTGLSSAAHSTHTAPAAHTLTNHGPTHGSPVRPPQLGAHWGV